MSNRQHTIDQINRRRVSAILRCGDHELANDAMQAAVDGGLTLVEFTLNTAGAFELIARFAARADLVVGAGTVLTREGARRAVDAGARFLVSPICDPDIIGYARELDVAVIPGTHTATEMQTAHRAGADFVKLFPAPADLPGYIASVLGPLPHLRIFPTNGVTVENLPAVLAAGAAGAGFVRSLFVPEWMAARDFTAIRERAAAIVATAGASGPE